MKKKRKTNVRVLSVLLTLCLMLSVVFSAPMTVTAATVGERNDIIVSDAAVSKLESIDGNKEVVRTPIRRLYEEEGDDLNKTVWLNDDGTRTMTIYDYPVKFVNAAGQIQDISLDVAEATDGSGAFKTAAGWTNTVFPSKITDGVTLSGNGEALKLTPVMPQGSLVASAERSNKLVAKDKVSRKDNKTVSYNYDSKTNIEYSLTYNGFKEDIVVNEYTGQTEYSFLLETNGLTLVNNNGSYHLEDAKGNIKASVGDVIIFTADERNNTMGYMTHTTVKENHSYFLTIHVDADWLKDEKTVYPIRIDPTLEMTDTEKLVEDVTIYSGGAVNPTSTILCVGNRSDLGVCRTLMKFPNLDLSDINGSMNVVSAGIKLYDLYTQAEPMGVYCYIYDGNAWEDNTATWGNNANGYTHFMSHNDVSRENTAIQVARNWYYFSITDAVKYWLLTDEQKAARPDNFDMEKGIMLKAKNDTTMDYQYKAFGSYNNATYRPQIEIIYSNATATPSKPFGWFDKVNANEISGWAWCFDYPETSLVCEIVLYNESKDKEYRYCCASNLYREDVADAGYGTGAYAFRFPVDWNALSRGKYRVEVFAYDQNNEEKYLLPQSPQTFNNSRYLITPSGFTGSMLKGEVVKLSATSVLDHVDVSWLSSNSDVVSVSELGVATAKNAGKATITAKFTNPNTGSVALEQVNVAVVSDLIGLSDLTKYYIMNTATEKYISAPYGPFAEYQTIFMSDKTTDSRCEWMLDFNIGSKVSVSYNHAAGEKWMMHNGSLAISALPILSDFTVTRVELGIKDGLYTISCGDQYLTQDPNSNNIVLTASPTDYSYWSFMKVDKGNASIVTFNYKFYPCGEEATFDTTHCNDYFKGVFNQFGYLSNSYVNTSVDTAYACLQNSDVYLYYGHGTSSCLSFVGENDISYGSIGTDPWVIWGPDASISEIEYNGLSSLRCVIYMGCKTGLEFYGSSIVDATFNKGAHFVLGLTEVVTIGEATSFLYGFFEGVYANKNIEHCIISGLDSVDNYVTSNGIFTQGVFPIICRGDMKQYLG